MQQQERKRALVFISYSHDSQRHLNRVFELGERLRKLGFDCRLDQHEVFPAVGWPQWTSSQVASAACVLVVCTRTYLDICRHGQQGQLWQGPVLQPETFTRQGPRFVPVLFENEDAPFIPEPLQAFSHFHIAEERGLELLAVYLGEKLGFGPGPAPACAPLLRRQTFTPPLPPEKPWRLPGPASAHFCNRDRQRRQLEGQCRKAGIGRITASASGMGRSQIVLQHAVRHGDDYTALLWLDWGNEPFLRHELAVTARALGIDQPGASVHEMLESLHQWLCSHSGWLAALRGWHPEAPPTRILTSRRPQGCLLLMPPAGLLDQEDAAVMQVDALAEKDFLALLRGRTGRRALMRPEREAALRLAESLGCATVLLDILGALAQRNSLQFQEIDERIGGEDDVPLALLRLCVNDAAPELARLLCLMVVPGAPRVPEDALLACAGLPPEQSQQGLALLQQASRMALAGHFGRENAWALNSGLEPLAMKLLPATERAELLHEFAETLQRLLKEQPDALLHQAVLQAADTELGAARQPGDVLPEDQEQAPPHLHASQAADEEPNDNVHAAPTAPDSHAAPPATARPASRRGRAQQLPLSGVYSSCEAPRAAAPPAGETAPEPADSHGAEAHFAPAQEADPAAALHTSDETPAEPAHEEPPFGDTGDPALQKAEDGVTQEAAEQPDDAAAQADGTDAAAPEVPQAVGSADATALLPEVTTPDEEAASPPEGSVEEADQGAAADAETQEHSQQQVEVPAESEAEAQPEAPWPSASLPEEEPTEEQAFEVPPEEVQPEDIRPENFQPEENQPEKADLDQAAEPELEAQQEQEDESFFQEAPVEEQESRETHLAGEDDTAPDVPFTQAASGLDSDFPEEERFDSAPSFGRDHEPTHEDPGNGPEHGPEDPFEETAAPWQAAHEPDLSPMREALGRAWGRRMILPAVPEPRREGLLGRLSGMLGRFFFRSRRPAPPEPPALPEAPRMRRPLEPARVVTVEPPASGEPAPRPRAPSVRPADSEPDLPATAAECEKRAVIYRAQGRLREAEPFMARALQLQEKLHGPEHLESARAANALGELYRQMQELEQASPLLERALDIRVSVWGDEHPEVAQSCTNLGSLRLGEGRMAEAEALYVRSLRMDEALFGHEHPNTATDCNNLAVLYFRMERFAEALRNIKRAMIIREQTLGEGHPLHLQTCENCVAILRKLGRNREADEIQLRVRTLRTAAEEGQHDDGRQGDSFEAMAPETRRSTPASSQAPAGRQPEPPHWHPEAEHRPERQAEQHEDEEDPDERN